MTVSQDLAGRSAVVTGGASGLGRAIAARLAASGATVTIVDLERALSEVPEGQDSFPCDVGAPDARDRLASLADKIGTVDIVVANAGVVPPWRGLRALDADEWRRVMDVNVWGVAATIGGFADALARSEHASAIVMASINGFRAHASQVLYTASKHAVIGVMRAAALDLGRDGTRVNALAPGPIATSALLGRVAARHAEGGPSPENVLAAMTAETALGRMATEEDVADVAHFLASDASGGMTGSVFPVEAGLS
ncbi:MAG: SDR family oxidoreductase [Silicimonas sp.]|nr:SDR family oxidoreductase [Silicimonas sp.]